MSQPSNSGMHANRCPKMEFAAFISFVCTFNRKRFVNAASCVSCRVVIHHVLSSCSLILLKSHEESGRCQRKAELGVSIGGSNLGLQHVSPLSNIASSWALFPCRRLPLSASSICGACAGACGTQGRSGTCIMGRKLQERPHADDLSPSFYTACRTRSDTRQSTRPSTAPQYHLR
jgi:hypothetical protein